MAVSTEATTPAPEPIEDLTRACIRFVQTAVGVAPDLTQDTLPLLDHYAAEIPAETTEEVLGLIVPSMGAYFGEVVRHHLGEGVWEHPEGTYEAWRLTLPSSGLSFNPIAVALEVATGETFEGWPSEFVVPPAEREVARDAAERLGEVPEEQYYTFGTRFDVLEAIHQALAAKRAVGGADVEGA
jgi:hypothetical protein